MPKQYHLKYIELLGDNGFKVYYVNDVYMGDILMKEDGFYDWWPENRGGYITAWVLRELADKLDELNEPWQKQIDEYFNSNPKETSTDK